MHRTGTARAASAPRVAVVLGTLLAAAVVIAGACESERPPSSADGTVSAVASVPPLAWFVERIGGGSVPVTVMVPPGASPALYDPSLTQLRAVDAARLYIAVGHPRFPFERAWLAALTEGRPGLRVIRSGAACATDPADPHLWLSPECARTIARTVADALAEELPSASEEIAARRDSVLREIDEVDAALADALSPHAGRSFLVFHPALGYLARSYGLEQMAIQRGAAEPSPAEVAAVLREAREKGVDEVFVQPQFSTEAARTVAERLAEGRVVTVDPLASDWPSMMRSLGTALAASFEEWSDGSP